MQVNWKLSTATPDVRLPTTRISVRDVRKVIYDDTIALTNPPTDGMWVQPNRLRLDRNSCMHTGTLLLSVCVHSLYPGAGTCLCALIHRSCGAGLSGDSPWTVGTQSLAQVTQR